MSDELTPEENLPSTSGMPAQQPVFASKAGMWSRGSGDTSGYGGLQRELTMPGQSEPPFDEPADAIHSRALEVLPEELGGARVLFDRGELTIYVPREHLTAVAKTFRDDPHLRFEVCVSVSGVHYPQEKGEELHPVYHLLSYTHNRRVRLEVSCPDEAQAPIAMTHLGFGIWS